MPEMRRTFALDIKDKGQPAVSFTNVLTPRKKMRQDVHEQKMQELTADGRLLAVSHMPMAYAMAWRLKDCGVSLEDLRQEGCLGLCEAAMRFDESLGCRFATYAAYWCRKLMLRAIYRRPETNRLDDETYREPDDADDLLCTGQQRCVDEAMQLLQPQEQQLVRLHYGFQAEALSLSDIAEQMGISVSRASVLHQEALLKLKATLRRRPTASDCTDFNL